MYMSSDEKSRLRTLGRSGMCCASILVQMGLDLREESNDQFVRSVSGLCNGLHSGLLCGALSGGACMLGLFAETPAESAEMVRELVSWFESTYESKFGGVDCSQMTGCDRSLRLERCPGIAEETYIQLKSILSDYGKI